MCTPLMMIWAKLLGKVEFSRFYSCGLFHIFLHKNSYLSIGENCHFMSKSWGNRLGLYHRCILSTEPGARIIIGKNCGLSGVTIRCFRQISIGNNVRIGANSIIMDGDAHQDDSRTSESKSVFISDNVWVGANVTILKGVTIGENSLIGIGSVVTKSIPANVVAAGNPCRIIRNL